MVFRTNEVSDAVGVLSQPFLYFVLGSDHGCRNLDGFHRPEYANPLLLLFFFSLFLRENSAAKCQLVWADRLTVLGPRALLGHASQPRARAVAWVAQGSAWAATSRLTGPCARP